MTPPRSGPPHVIRDPEQLRALRTPTRLRVLNAILELAPCSVAQIAERLDWKAESLYYHLGALIDADLVRRAGERPGSSRPEALYEGVAPDVILDATNRSPEYLARVWDTYRAALRASERDLEKALREEVDGEGPRENTMLMQVTARLSAADANRVRGMLEEAVRFAIENEDRTESDTVSVTTAFARLGGS